MANLIVSATPVPFAALMALRSEPAPLSFVLLTANCAACADAADAATPAASIPAPSAPLSFLLSMELPLPRGRGVVGGGDLAASGAVGALTGLARCRSAGPERDHRRDRDGEHREQRD